MSKILSLQHVFLLIYPPQAPACLAGNTLSEVFFEFPLDTVPCWVVSEEKVRVEAISCPVK